MGAAGSKERTCFCSMLDKLLRLQAVTASDWCCEALPVFAQLTRLQEVQGHWVAAGRSGSNGSSIDGGKACNSVQRVLKASGFVLFEAFPGLRQISFAEMQGAAANSDMLRHFTALQRVGLEIPGKPASCKSVAGLSDQEAVQRLQLLISQQKAAVQPQEGEDDGDDSWGFGDREESEGQQESDG